MFEAIFSMKYAAANNGRRNRSASFVNLCPSCKLDRCLISASMDDIDRCGILVSKSMPSIYFYCCNNHNHLVV
jgi:hypothetical protein